jgi:hypothetical protein
MSEEGQQLQGQTPAPLEPFTGKPTKAQAGILRTLWDLENRQPCQSSLRHGLHSSAAKLVERGLIWKQDRWPARPLYGITPVGVPAALEAWREINPQLAQEEIQAWRQHVAEEQAAQLPPGVRPIVEEALATGDLQKANERLHKLSGGKTVGQLAEEWAGQMQTAPVPEQREQQQAQQPDPLLPPAEPRPSRPAEGQPYGVRVYQAYRALAEQYQSPDVRIDALHAKVGGSLQDLHQWLRQACLHHLAVPSSGEPAPADHAARQSALRLPGGSETFLRIKLLEPPTMSQDQPPKQHPTITLTLNVNQADLVAEALH